jgi:hypothetical protein
MPDARKPLARTAAMYFDFRAGDLADDPILQEEL